MSITQEFADKVREIQKQKGGIAAVYYIKTEKSLFLGAAKQLYDDIMEDRV